MSEVKVVVPDGMKQAVKIALNEAYRDTPFGSSEVAAEAACRWIMENPQTPSDKQIEQMLYGMKGTMGLGVTLAKRGAVEFQRMIFAPPEPEIPEEVKRLLWKANPFPNQGAEQRHDEAVRTAYELGRKAAK